MEESLGFLLVGFAILMVLILFTSLRIIKQYEKGLVVRLGKYARTLDSGIAFVFPFIESVIKIDMREQLINVLPQKVITQDNVTVLVDAVIYYRVVDPVKSEFEIENFGLACTTLAQTNLRNIIGDQSLDETLTARDIINTSLREVLDEATDGWGVKVTRVEVQKIDPPKDITDAMSKQMKAEREKRARILEAEGIKQSEILQAEGARQSAILEAEGKAKAQILQAEAQSKAIQDVSESAEAYFKSRAQAFRQFEVLEKTLQNNTKLIIPNDAPILNLLDLNTNSERSKNHSSAATKVIDGLKS